MRPAGRPMRPADPWMNYALEKRAWSIGGRASVSRLGALAFVGLVWGYVLVSGFVLLNRLSGYERRNRVPQIRE